MTETFFVGLARGGVELSGKWYRRQRLDLAIRPILGDLANNGAVTFPAAGAACGFVDGLALATSIDGPVIAVSPLLHPMHLSAGHAFVLDVDHVVMSRKSLAAIRAICPVAIAAPAV